MGVIEVLQILPLQGSDAKQTVSVERLDRASWHSHCNVVVSFLSVQPALQHASPAAKTNLGVEKRERRPRKARIRANFSFMSFLNFIMREGDISV